MCIEHLNNEYQLFVIYIGQITFLVSLLQVMCGSDPKGKLNGMIHLHHLYLGMMALVPEVAQKRQNILPES